MVQVKLVNVLGKEAQAMTDVMSLLRSGKAKLPIVLVNGDMKMNGSLSVDGLVPVISGLVKQS